MGFELSVIVLILVTAALAAAFFFSIKKTLYSVRNVLLLAGLLFCGTSLIGIALSWESMKLEHQKIAGAGIHILLTRLSVFISGYALILLLIGSLLMAVSNLALIRHEGKRLKNIYGTLLGLAFIAATLMLPLLKIPYLYCMLCYFECMTAAFALMGWIAAKQKPAYDKDFIVILGCSISKSGGLLPLLKQRVNRAMKYAWEQEIASGKPLKYVPSGGQGPDEVMSEGSAMDLYLESHSAEADEVLAEKKSRNTWENFTFSKKIIDDVKPDAKVAFATTNFHVFRSGLLARRAGFDDIEAISSETKWYFWPNGFAREIIGMFAMTWKIHLIAAILNAVICFIQM